MLLVVDVGNTQTLIGLYAPGVADLVDHWRIATHASRTSDECALVIGQLLSFGGFTFDEHLDGMAVSSVVPRVTAALREMSVRYLGRPALIIEPGVRTGMPILYDDPKEVGADRIANAVGAHDLYGGPTVVVDFGTATTFDAISEKGQYLGGAIVPGIEVSFEALFGRAAGLRRVELAEPRQVIGRSTVESLRSGAVYGYAAQVDGLCSRFAAEIGEATVVATGGLASLVLPHLEVIAHHEPWLTLHGLRLIYDRNLR